jgi:hypothetical protein
MKTSIPCYSFEKFCFKTQGSNGNRVTRKVICSLSDISVNPLSLSPRSLHCFTTKERMKEKVGSKSA